MGFDCIACKAIIATLPQHTLPLHLFLHLFFLSLTSPLPHRLLSMGAGPSRRVVLQSDGASVVVTEAVIRAIATDDEESIPTQNTQTQRQESTLLKEEIEQLSNAWQELERREHAIQQHIDRAFNLGVEKGANNERTSKEEELRSLDAAWQRKMDDSTRKREEDATEEFLKAQGRLKGLFSVSAEAEAACPADQGKLVSCLAANKGKPLNCSDEVKAFLACAERARLKYLTSANH